MSYIAGIVLFNPEIDRLVDNIEAIYKPYISRLISCYL